MCVRGRPPRAVRLPGLLVSAFVSQPGQRPLIMEEMVPAAMSSSVCRKLSRSGSAASASIDGEAPALHLVSSMVLQMLQACCADAVPLLLSGPWWPGSGWGSRLCAMHARARCLGSLLCHSCCPLQ